jgi:hypothetical protein
MEQLTRLGCCRIEDDVGREPKLEKLDIPEVSWETKSWFPTRESVEAVVPEILDHIRTKLTYLCRVHTHSAPPKGATPVYVREFDVPKRLGFAPCPCCWPSSPKFSEGIVAWFRDEGVIRLMGRHCFKALNPEAHTAARKQFEVEERRRRDTEFLLTKLPSVPSLIAVGECAIGVAVAVEMFHQQLHRKLSALSVDLWRHARSDGELSVSAVQTEFRRGANGEMYEHEQDVLRVAFRLPGFKMLDPGPLRISTALEKVNARLEAIDFGDEYELRTATMTDEEKHKCADTLSRAVGKLREQVAIIDDRRKFVEPLAINTLRSWGREQGCPIPLIYAHNGSRISIGRVSHQMIAVEIPDGTDSDIGDVEF